MTNNKYKGRKALHAYLTTETHEAWHSTCAELGLNVSALLEVMGLHLDQIVSRENTTNLDPSQLIEDARKLAADRRRRKVRVL